MTIPAPRNPLLTRLATAWLALTCIAAPSGAQGTPASAPAPDPMLFAQLGFDNQAMANRWMPVRAIIQGGAEPVAGAVIVETSQGLRPESRSIRPFVATPGQTITVELVDVVSPSMGRSDGEATLTIRLVSESGRTIRTLSYTPIQTDRTLGLPLFHDETSIFVLNVGIDSLRTDAAKWASGRARSAGPTAEFRTGPPQQPTNEYWGSVVVPNLTPDALPRTWAGYDAVEAVAITARDLAALADQQTTALDQWVRSGGRLLIIGPSAGRDLSRWLAHAPPEAARFIQDVDSVRLPVNASGESRLLGGWTAQPLSSPAEAGRAEHILSGPLGLGRLSFLPRDPALTSIGDADGRWQPVLAAVLGAPLLTSPRPPTTPGTSDLGPSALLDALVERMNISNPPPITLFALFGIALALLIGPIDRLLLRRLRRSHLSWATSAAWIGLFALAGYFWPRLLRDGDTQLSTVRVFDSAEPVDPSTPALAWRQSYTTILPASTGSRTLLGEFTGSWWRSIDPREYWRADRALSLFSTDQSGAAEPLPVSLDIWSPRTLAETGTAAPPFRATAVRQPNGEITITLRGQSSEPSIIAAVDRPTGSERITLSRGPDDAWTGHAAGAATTDHSEYLRFDAVINSPGWDNQAPRLQQAACFTPGPARRGDAYLRALQDTDSILLSFFVEAPSAFTLDEPTRSRQLDVHRILIPVQPAPAGDTPS